MSVHNWVTANGEPPCADVMTEPETERFPSVIWQKQPLRVITHTWVVTTADTGDQLLCVLRCAHGRGRYVATLSNHVKAPNGTRFLGILKRDNYELAVEPTGSYDKSKFIEFAARAVDTVRERRGDPDVSAFLRGERST